MIKPSYILKKVAQELEESWQDYNSFDEDTTVYTYWINDIIGKSYTVVIRQRVRHLPACIPPLNKD